MKNNRKQKELYVLKKIYNISSGLELLNEEKESPDFWLKYCTELKYFGVEITSLFIDETDARIKRNDKYITELIEHNKFKDKKDISRLNIVDTNVFDKKGNLKIKMKGVLKRGPKILDYRNSLKNRIIDKENKIHNYDVNLKHNSLIIYDESDSLRFADMEYFEGRVLNDEIKEVIINSSFHEIYLLTIFKNGERYIPLKGLVFIKSILYFNNAYYSFYENEIAKIKYNEEVVIYLNGKGFKGLQYGKDEGIFELIYCDTYYVWEYSNVIQFHILNDMDFFCKSNIIIDLKNRKPSKAFANFLNDFKNDYFVNYVFDSNK